MMQISFFSPPKPRFGALSPKTKAKIIEDCQIPGITLDELILKASEARKSRSNTGEKGKPNEDNIFAFIMELNGDANSGRTQSQETASNPTSKVTNNLHHQNIPSNDPVDIDSSDQQQPFSSLNSNKYKDTSGSQGKSIPDNIRKRKASKKSIDNLIEQFTAPQPPGKGKRDFTSESGNTTLKGCEIQKRIDFRKRCSRQNEP